MGEKGGGVKGKQGRDRGIGRERGGGGIKDERERQW